MELRFERDTVESLFEFGSPDDALEFYLDTFGPLIKARELAESEGRWPALRDDVAAYYGRYTDPSARRLKPAEYLLVLGRARGLSRRDETPRSVQRTRSSRTMNAMTASVTTILLCTNAASVARRRQGEATEAVALVRQALRCVSVLDGPWRFERRAVCGWRLGTRGQ